MTAMDHGLAAALLFLSLAQAFMRRPDQLDGEVRITLYSASALFGGAVGAAIMLLWTFEGRAIAEFGLGGWAGPSPGLTVAAALLWALVLAGAVRAVSRGRQRSWLRRFYAPYG